MTAFCSKPMFMSDLRETLLTAIGQKEAQDNACGAGVAVRRVGGALLMGGEYVADAVPVAVKLVIEIQNGAAGIPENGVHILLQQALHDGFGGGDLQNAFLLSVSVGRMGCTVKNP